MTSEANIPVRRGVASHLFDDARTLHRGTSSFASSAALERWDVLFVARIRQLARELRSGAIPTLGRPLRMRAELGYPTTNSEDKVTLLEAHEIVAHAGLAHCASVLSSSMGLSALGFEILIKKPLHA